MAGWRGSEIEVALDFPLWIRLTHFFNFLFLSLLVRSGLEILSAHPRLYWNDDCTPGSEWLTLTRAKRPDTGLWTGRDEERKWSSWLALPGGGRLGLGRHWHFLIDLTWLITGIIYLVLLFAADEWRRLVPTTWAIIPGAWDALIRYLSLHLVVLPDAYNPLQQLTYFAVVFILAPISILTGIAMSPAITARYPWYTHLFGGRQAARSIHFLALCAWILFFIVHVVVVILHGLGEELAMIVLGETEDPRKGLAIVIGAIGVGVVIAVNVAVTIWSQREPRRVQNAIEVVTDPVRSFFFGHQHARERYSREDISPSFWVNGRPPPEEDYQAMVRSGFAAYRLEVGGLVEEPLRLSLAELHALPRQVQVTKHICIQGWSGIAEWGGVPLGVIIDLCRPLPEAKHLLFLAFDDKSTSEPHSRGKGSFYETIDLDMALRPQTILAYEMNGETLPVEYGAPLRLRVETQLGFKMVKYLRSIEFIDDYRTIGLGQGGWREDYQYYSREAGI